MKYITELDTDRIRKIAGKLPNNSALVTLDDHIFALNVSSALWTMSEHTDSVELALAKDMQGQISIQIDRNSVARKLYEIAEPDGASWQLISRRDKEKYIRMQEAGIKP